MKTKKIIFGLSFLAILTVCTLNVQSSLNVSSKLGYTSLVNLITLNSASAEEGGDGDCNGSSCNNCGVNGLNYNTFFTANTVNCCGAVSQTCGKKID